MTSIPNLDQSSNARIFVRGLPVRIEKDAIVEFFSKFGLVEHCKLKRNNKTKRSMGYACVTFRDAQVAQSLIDRPIDFYGRVCECKPVLKTKELEEHLSREKKLKVKLANLDPKASNEDLLQALRLLASFAYAYVVKEQPDSEESKGFGFVMFNSEPEVAAFCRNARHLFVRGRRVQVASEEYSHTAADHDPETKKVGCEPSQLQAAGASHRASVASSAGFASHSHGTHTSGTRPHLRQSTGPIGWPNSESEQAEAPAHLRPQASFYSLWSTRTISHVSAGSRAAQACADLRGPLEPHVAESSSSDKKSSSPSQTAHGSYRSLSRFNSIAYASRQIDERVENYRFNSPLHSTLGKKSLCAAMPSQPAQPKFLQACSRGDIARQQVCAA